MMAVWTFYLETFGCKVNQYESQALREAWTALGGTEVSSPAGADWVVLNSCAVTAQAVSDVRQAVRRVHRLNPDTAIVLTGCSASAAGPHMALLPGIAAIIPQSDKQRLLAGPPFTSVPLVPTPRTAAPEATPDQILSVPDSASGTGFPPFTISAYQRARPVLKVQDGCSHRCTYCIVPLLRGPARSRSVAAVLAEAERLLAAGHRELMLSGINLHQYATDDAADFWDLLATLDRELAPQWEGVARLRISSLDPAQLGSKARDTLAGARLVCPHLHLSLQSGSPGVLRQMGRGHYQPECILDEVAALRRLWPVCGLGADILMGFPGESDAQCDETLTMLTALKLTYGHVFPFSARPGTVAAYLQDLPRAIKQQRAHKARVIIQSSRQAFLERLVQESIVLVARDISSADALATDNDPATADTEKGSSAPRGVTEHYVPCRLADGHDAWNVPDGLALVPARPVGNDRGRLLVVPAS